MPNKQILILIIIIANLINISYLTNVSHNLRGTILVALISWRDWILFFFDLPIILLKVDDMVLLCASIAG
jgi:hypothetical protein